MAYSNKRNAEDIKRELCALIPSLKDPRISEMLTVVRTELSGDGSLCRVYVSSLEGLKVSKVSARGLTAAGGFIRHEIGTRLRLRVIPKFEFIADDSIEYSADIARKIRELGIESGEDKREEVSDETRSES